MTIHFRKAELSDIEVLLTFEQELIQHELPMDLSMKRDEKIYYYNLPELIHSPDVEFLVAVTDQKVVGCGYGKIKENTEKQAEGKYGYIGFMFVAKDYRGNRIGEQIINRLNGWFRSKQIRETRLDVYDQNPNAIRAYQRAGFSKLKLEMIRFLED
ncbi:GNAT family N-acetyltransferase [Rapidithrix thailandica]|uniref:GNAT family N-acetyltransferase n=1 Tax=Rapidithrix thailandica TaxID=413964 RepID=A0AAW9RTK0_9BACT